MLRRRRSRRAGSAQEQGRRYLREGRLTVAFVDGAVVSAVCEEGRGGLRNLGHDSGRGWWCSCREEGGQGGEEACGHLDALRLVVGEPGRGA